MRSKGDWVARARELADSDCSTQDYFLSVKAALQLGIEMADARAEEIAQLCYRSDGPSAGIPEAAAIARATITKPKTRESVMEKALREIERMTLPGEAKNMVARRALEWTP